MHDERTYLEDEGPYWLDLDSDGEVERVVAPLASLLERSRWEPDMPSPALLAAAASAAVSWGYDDAE